MATKRYLRLEEEDPDKALKIRKNALYWYANCVADSIETATPESRMKALALTKLDECVMWAEKAIEHDA